jgi:hypothetical protein
MLWTWRGTRTVRRAERFCLIYSKPEYRSSLSGAL